MKRWLAVVALAWCSLVFADAQTDAQIRSVEAQLQRVQQEQQSLFQQFQMIQELRRTEMQAENPSVVQNYTPLDTDNPPPNYDDVVREKKQREGRIKKYTDDLNRMYARYRELDEQKQSLLKELDALTQTK